MRRRQKRSERRTASAFDDINVTSLIDVSLLLLIVFMIVAPTMQGGVAVELPKAGKAPIPSADKPLTITVTPDGRTYLGDRPVSTEELETNLASRTDEEKKAPVYVRGDRGAGYGTVMEVLGSVKDAGFTSISLLTESKAH